MSTLLGEPRHSIEIAANTETAIAGEIALAIEQRQAREFDRQTATAIHRPEQRDATPCLLRGHRLDDVAIGIEVEFGCQIVPLTAKASPLYRGPIRWTNSSEFSVKRFSASICHTKRSGVVRGSISGSATDAGWSATASTAGDCASVSVGASACAMVSAITSSRCTSRSISAFFRLDRSVDVDRSVC